MQNPFRSTGPAPNSFLPQDYIARKSDAKANIFLLSFFAIVMAAVVGAFMVTYRQKVELRQHLVSVSAKYNAEAKKIEQLKQLETQRAQIMEKAQVTAALVERVPRWAVNQEIALRMAPTMRLHEFKVKSTRTDPTPPPTKDAPPPVKSLTGKLTGKKDEPKAPTIMAPTFRYNVTIIGGAKENNDIADFIRSLRESPILDDVELAYIREGKGDEILPRKFEISAILRSDTNPDALSKSLQDLLAKRTAMMGLTPSDEPGSESPKSDQPSLASTIGKLLGGGKSANKDATPSAAKPTDPNATDGAIADAQENNP